MEERCGPWRLVQLVAAGGIGEIWRVVGPGEELGALKRLHTHLLRHALVREQFERECELLCELPPHPAIVRGLGRGEVGGRPWVVMQLARGEDLRRHLDGPVPPGAATGAATSGPMSRQLALEVVARAASAVAHLHELGWVHGDVVPANLVLDGAPPQLLLCDLGLARRFGGGGPAQGTHAYMAPEQARGEPWQASVDVFALGVVLWELLAGKRLFHRGPPWLTMEAVLTAEVPRLGDAALDELLARALAKDASARLPDGAALAAALATISAPS